MEKNPSVNWNDYFFKIKSVCPWSWRAWNEGLIEIAKWQKAIRPLGQLEARVYTSRSKPRLVKKQAKRLQTQYPEYELLVSARSYGPNGTPISVVIQQDRAKLQYLRDKLALKYQHP